MRRTPLFWTPGRLQPGGRPPGLAPMRRACGGNWVFQEIQAIGRPAYPPFQPFVLAPLTGGPKVRCSPKLDLTRQNKAREDGKKAASGRFSHLYNLTAYATITLGQWILATRRSVAVSVRHQESVPGVRYGPCMEVEGTGFSGAESAPRAPSAVTVTRHAGVRFWLAEGPAMRPGDRGSARRMLCRVAVWGRWRRRGHDLSSEKICS